MGETSDGLPATGQRVSDDGDPDSPARSTFFSRLFRRDAPEAEQTDQASGDSDPARAASNDREMMVNLRNLRQMRVDDVSVPRADIVAVSDDSTIEDLVSVFQSSTLSRLPVYSETLDQPKGLVHLKDLALNYGFGATKRPFDLTPLVRPLLYVPPSMSIGALLRKMQAAHVHMALVIDEYGGVDGLVTFEDLLEQVVGDIADEHDEAEDKLWSDEGDGVFLAQARADLADFEEETGTRLASRETAEKVHTLGGLVTRLAGRVPAIGEIVAHPDGHEFEVVDADARKIKGLRLRLRRETAKPSEAAE
ncbi:hemolysin family protein [Amaricoccus sp.]|uniref:hemolysin family protein n=1 Tax=Amaricoccus sp. TaxID=1872485 RepID=UPI00261F3E06|nr:hemolysin family protein [uncultured Amaricoccus sp.]